MLTANEAREKANAIKNDLSKELFEIENRIEESVLLGQFSIASIGRISPTLRGYLESIGYKVKIGCQYNEPCYSISWD